MKKIIALLAVVVLAVSCSKKEKTYEQDSNVMLPEPEVTVVDTTKIKTDNATVATPAADSTATVKKDSVK